MRSEEQEIVTPICGCLSCHDQAHAVVRHPTKGRRTVCEYHAFGYEVLEEL